MLLEDVLKPKKIYLDVDGVFANFEEMVSDHFGTPFKQVDVDKMWDFIHDRLKNKQPVFSELNKMPDADALMKYVKGYDIEFLTSAGDRHTPEAVRQKKAWLKKNYPGIKVNTVPTSKEKARWAEPAAVLIDDRTKSINPWVAAGGIGILHKDTRNTIKKLKELGL
jgi:5'(3')-deoxyribonucleotidase